MAITVMQVFKALGVTPSPNVSWSVGATVAANYKRLHGAYPPKELHPKTNGNGTHCFAEYPPSWRPYIEEVIKATIDFERHQGDLFQ